MNKRKIEDYSVHLVTNIGSLKVLSPNCLSELSALTKVITPESPSVTEKCLRSFFLHGGKLAYACHEGSIVGAAYIIYVHKCNSTSARLEHVSVLPEHEGVGIACKIITMLITDTRMMGEVKFIDLTCEPKRGGANALYEKLGFLVRETNARRLRFQSAA